MTITDTVMLVDESTRLIVTVQSPHALPLPLDMTAVVPDGPGWSHLVSTGDLIATPASEEVKDELGVTGDYTAATVEVELTNPDDQIWTLRTPDGTVIGWGTLTALYELHTVWQASLT